MRCDRCKHCKRRKCDRPRGLCSTCYFTPSIREQYKTKFNPTANPLTTKGIEPVPTSYLPGTQGKVEALALRVKRGERLWHKDDAGMGDQRQLACGVVPEHLC